MIALVLAGLLAQPAPASTSGPAGLASPAPTTQSAVASPIPAASPAPVDGTITRRPPDTTPGIVPVVAAGDAVIRNSGSTNTSGYTIVVHPDFSADVYEQGTTRHATVAEAQAKWFFAKLKAAEPLTALGAGRCMKSASFGTRTSISYDGATTPDISCPGGDDTRELERTVGVIVDQLGIKPTIGRFRTRML